MQVIINEGGLTCTTVNHLGGYPSPRSKAEKIIDKKQFESYENDCNKRAAWHKAQSERQTFEIEHECEEGVCSVEIPLSLKTRCRLIPGTTHEAQIVNGKAVIK